MSDDVVNDGDGAAATDAAKDAAAPDADAVDAAARGADASGTETGEADAAAAGTGDADPAAADADPPAAVPGGPTAYDFAHPGHRLASDWPLLDLLHRQCASTFLARVGERFRLVARGAPMPSRRLRPDELAASLADDALLRELRLAPLPGVALLALDATLLPALVDAWFGGSGTSLERAASASPVLSATERRALAHLLDAFTVSLADAWRDLAALEPALGRETTPQRLAHGGWTDVAIDCGLALALGGDEHALRLLYPAAMLEPFAERLAREDRSEPVRDARFDEAMRQGLLECELEISGVLAETRVTLRELMRLKPGDFIPLRDVETVSFRTERLPLFDAAVGQSNGRVSASLSRWHLPERKR